MQSQRQSWLPMVAISLSMVMMYITSFGVNVLINAIVNDLQTTVVTLQSVIVSASFIAGSLMVTAGRLGDKFGKKRIFVLGVAIYTLGLTGVVLSPNTLAFSIAWGVIWPSGMVLIIPTSIALIMHYYHGKQRAQAFGIYGAILSVVSALAPVLVGVLSDLINWRIALALSPIMGVATLLVSAKLPETNKDARVEIDLLSVLLSVVSFGLFLYAVTLAGQYGWIFEKRPFAMMGMQWAVLGLSPVPFIYLASFLLSLVFIYRGNQLKKQGRSPLLDSSLLLNIPFSIGMWIGALFFMVGAGFLFAYSVYLQAGAEMSGLDTALTTLPYAITVAVVSFASPKLASKLAPKWIIIIGALVMIYGMYLTGQHASLSMVPSDVLVAMTIVGIGAGLVMAQYTNVTMMSVKPEDSGAASGLSETMKEIVGQGFAVAFAGSILFSAVYASMTDSYAEKEGLTLESVEHSQIVVELEDTFNTISPEEEAQFVASLPKNTREAYPQIVQKAANDGLQITLYFMMLAMLLVALMALAAPSQRVES
ncbi:MFS transporter [Paraferrimonas sp. SM1919]|uniref:MFS transporter n=1 Tax=Paraferrimonas sp. SM1919 TaxID=2662263 RepID=UPI0013D77797|nr:MFS transporter [Paraferrimonas sp. SM1919]